MEVLGIKKGSFRDRNTGNEINYGHLHVADIDENVVGRAVEVLKLPAKLLEIIEAIEVGDHIAVTYNKFGKPDTIIKVKASNSNAKQ